MRKEATVVEPAWIESLRWRLSLVERRQWMRIFGTTLAAAVLLLVAFWPPRSLATASDTQDDLETEPELAR